MRSLLIAGLIAGSTTLCAAVPTVGIQLRGPATVAEGNRISWYYTNSLLPTTWDAKAVLEHGVSIKYKISGNATIADFKNLSSVLTNGTYTSSARGSRTVDVLKDTKVEGTETVTLEILPDPSYRIDPARSKITFEITD